jgi:hypothetical protein
MFLVARVNSTYRVIAEHHASFPYSLVLRAGDTVTVSERRESGWIWCMNDDGVGAWIPETYLKQEDRRATVLADYDSTELSTKIGEELSCLNEESGWIWCVNQAGQQGWVPAAKVKKLTK